MPQHLEEAVKEHSRFLADEVTQHPDWLRDIDIDRPPGKEQLIAELDVLLSPGIPAAVILAQFRRRQLLRILLRDVLGIATLAEITEELSTLADSILEVSYARIRAALAERHGDPETGFSVVALGKLGGRELNYSSDIDLMFIYGENGQTSSGVSYAEFFKRVSTTLTEVLSTYTPAGLCYRVDLRLRPDGRLGEACISLEGAKKYYETRARDWELQMLIKARVAAGEPEPGREMLEAAEPRIYSTTLDFSSVEAVSLTRERIHEKLASRRGRGEQGLDIKLTRGGIRDVEFLVQCLQRLHGGREPWVRHAGTLLALTRLADKQLISQAEYSRLANAYQFFRYLEHRLQFWDDRQTHELPASKPELEALAQRMPSAELGRMPSGEKLLHRLNVYLEDVQETYDRVIHSQQPLYYSAPVSPHPVRA